MFFWGLVLAFGKKATWCAGMHTLLRRELLNDHDDIFRRKRTFKIDVKWTKVYIDEAVN